MTLTNFPAACVQHLRFLPECQGEVGEHVDLGAHLAEIQGRVGGLEGEEEGAVFVVVLLDLALAVLAAGGVRLRDEVSITRLRPIIGCPDMRFI